MAQLFSLSGGWYPGQKVTFNKYELNQILSIYGANVAKGKWRDYALDSTSNSAIFSIYRHSHEKPAFTVTKIMHKGLKKQAKFIVYTDEKTLSKGNTILEVLQIFYEIDKNSKQDKKK